jgi:hypothetical protein
MDEYIDAILAYIRDHDISVPYSRSRGRKYKNYGSYATGSKTPAGCGNTVLLGPNPYKIQTPTNFTQAHPELYSLFLGFAERYVPFPVQNIMFNHNYQTRPHYDSLNVGDSAIISFGNYTGGELIVEGEVLDAYRKLRIMNGSKQLHWNKPITSGNKYSLVFFRTRQKVDSV